VLLRAGAAARDCPARSPRAPDAALSRFTAPTTPPPARPDDATSSDSNFTSFFAVTADWGCRRRKGGGGAADAGGGSSTFTRARGMCVDVGWCCWRVTGQQHAQEFVLECFLRLRRLPSRATNNGGGGLRREFNIARKPLGCYCAHVAFNQNLFRRGVLSTNSRRRGVDSVVSVTPDERPPKSP
jgi:hypothetical protein